MDLSISLELHEGMGASLATELAHVAEACGMRSVYAADHLLGMSGRTEVTTLDPWIVLSILASATSRVRLGSLASPVAYRPAAVSTKLVASLDIVSNGRAEIGLGLGWNEPEHHAYGIPFPRRADRIAMLDEQLQILRLCWQERPFTFRGRFYRMENCDFSPRPSRSTGVPVIVGGMSRSRDLPELAVRLADGYALGKATPKQAAVNRKRLDELCVRAGRDPATLTLSVVTRFCVGRSTEDAEASYATLSRKIRPASAGTATWLYGDLPTVGGQIAAYREAGVDQLVVACEHSVHLPMLDLLGEVTA